MQRPSQINEESSFYPNGTLRTLQRYLEGQLHGEILLYWPNGKLKRKVHFDRGVRDGTDEMWDATGNLVDQDCYVLGKRK